MPVIDLGLGRLFGDFPQRKQEMPKFGTSLKRCISLNVVPTVDFVLSGVLWSIPSPHNYPIFTAALIKAKKRGGRSNPAPQKLFRTVFRLSPLVALGSNRGFAWPHTINIRRYSATIALSRVYRSRNPCPSSRDDRPKPNRHFIHQKSHTNPSRTRHPLPRPPYPPQTKPQL